VESVRNAMKTADWRPGADECLSVWLGDAHHGRA